MTVMHPLRGILGLWLVPLARYSRADSPDWISALGAKISEDRAGNIVAVDLRGSWVYDSQLIDLAKLPHLEKLDLSHTRISDEGMLYLRSAPEITDLNLYYAEQITDQGMSCDQGLEALEAAEPAGNPHLRRHARNRQPSHATGSAGYRQHSRHRQWSRFPDDADQPERAFARARRESDNEVEVLRLLPTLTYLNLSGPSDAERPDSTYRKAGDSGPMRADLVRAIAELKDLRVLKLGYSNITADGLRMLSGLDKVEKLGLEACVKIDDTSLATLAGWKASNTSTCRRAGSRIEVSRAAKSQTRSGVPVVASGIYSTQPFRVRALTRIPRPNRSCLRRAGGRRVHQLVNRPRISSDVFYRRRGPVIAL